MDKRKRGGETTTPAKGSSGRVTRSSSKVINTTTTAINPPKRSKASAKGKAPATKVAEEDANHSGEVFMEAVEKKEVVKPKEITEQDVLEAVPEDPPAPPPGIDIVGLEAVTIPKEYTETKVSTEQVPDTPLPPNFTTLEHQFNALLTAIMFIRSRRVPTIWTNLHKPIEDLCGKTFNPTHLQQIISVSPETLRVDLRRTKTLKGEEDVIGIDIVVAHLTNLNSHRKQFHDSLTEIVVQHHNKYVARAKTKKTKQQQQQQQPQQHTETCKCLDSLPAIPTSPLPTSRRLSLGGSNTTPQPTVEYNGDLTNNSTGDHHENITSNNILPTHNNNNTTTNNTHNTTENNNLTVDNVKVVQQRRRIPILTRMIASIFSSYKKTTMPFEILAEKVLATAELPFEKKEVTELIHHMIQIVPNFINMYTENSSGVAWVKIDRQSFSAALRTVNSGV